MQGVWNLLLVSLVLAVGLLRHVFYIHNQTLGDVNRADYKTLSVKYSAVTGVVDFPAAGTTAKSRWVDFIVFVE